MRVTIEPPLPQQRAILASDSARRLYVAGVGAGKTRGLCYLALQAGARQPGVTGAILAPTYQLFSDVVLPAWQSVIPPELYTWRAAARTIELVNGTRILCRGCDQPEKRIIGLNLAWCCIDEAGQLRTVRAVKMAMQRLRQGDPRERFLALFTSPHGHGWLSDWSEQTDASGARLVDVQRATTYDNPHLPADYIRDLEVEFPPGTPLHEQELLGRFIVETGLIYGDVFAVDCHTSEAVFDPELPYELGVDPGYRASAWLAFQRQRGQWHVVHEWLPHGEFTDDTARQVLSDLGAPPQQIFCDTPSRSNTRTGLTDVEAMRAVFRGVDVRVVAGHRRRSQMRHHAVSAAISSGALAVSRHLCPRRIVGDERGIVYALQSIEWPKASTRDERRDETDPRKHVIDALEFWTVSRLRPRLGTPQQRAERLAA